MNNSRYKALTIREFTKAAKIYDGGRAGIYEMCRDDYPPILEENTKVMADIFGYSETLYVCNTYQFGDYSRYDFNLFREEDKRRYRDEHFEIDLQNAFDLGKRLTEKAEA